MEHSVANTTSVKQIKIVLPNWAGTIVAKILKELFPKCPSLNTAGEEVANSERDNKIYSLYAKGESRFKRCVYRGRGAICHSDYDITAGIFLHGDRGIRTSCLQL